MRNFYTGNEFDIRAMGPSKKWFAIDGSLIVGPFDTRMELEAYLNRETVAEIKLNPVPVGEPDDVEELVETNSVAEEALDATFQK